MLNHMKRVSTSTILSLTLLLCLTMAAPALAQLPSDGGQAAKEQCKGDPNCVTLENPIKAGPQGEEGINFVLGRTIQVLLGLLGAFALFMFVDGGFTWLTSGGKPERIRKGLMTMGYAVIGMFVIFASYGILGALISELTK
jgi:hypothetical protein